MFIVGETYDPHLVDEALLKRGFELIKVPMPDETADALAAVLQGSPGRELVDMVRRSIRRAADQAFDLGEDPAGAALTRDLLLADEMLRASSSWS